MESSIAEEEQVPVPDYWDLKPRQLVAIACAFALGCSLLVFQVDPVFIALSFIALATLKIFNFKSRHLLVLSLAILLGLLDAQLQRPRPDCNSTLSKLCSAGIVSISGTVSELKLFPSRKGLRILLDAEEGKLQVLVLFKKEELSNSNESALPQMAERIVVKGKLHSLADSRRMARMTVPLMRKGVFYQIVTSPKSVTRFSPLPVPTGSQRSQTAAPDLVGAEPGRSGGSPVSKESGSVGSQPASDLLKQSASQWRDRIVHFHRLVLGDKNGSLLSSMVLGDRAVNLDESIIEKFRIAGLSHVLAASGFNLSIVAASIFFVVRFIGNVWLSNLFCFIGMLTFVFVAGPSPSVLRAFIMGTLVLLSSCLSRKIHLPAALSATMLLVMLFDPWSCADLGFQLSYFCTAAMILGTGQIGSLLNKTWPSCPPWLHSIIAASLVAQAAVLPLQLHYFGQFNTYCLISNILVAPLVPVVTILGFASSFFFAIESCIHAHVSVAALIDKCCFPPIELIDFIVSKIAEAPYALVKTEKANYAAVLFAYVILFLFPYLKMKKRIKLWFFLYCLSSIVLLFTVIA